ncbi:GAF domain-like protein [Guyanagaster necrorhizus]|uniref:GAF domain-like protein n=1 Tax=Guyanagaster necrorhizus TaxID=856835 RepID=A0A9P7VSC6_9AGAR|nr:GAF domain-like protein [Guyanagaster necrorhizus MCA 3950]KAG7446551.1 GAF domain-like protein [Guyanagaster necrorhizus MCA 3950]
MPHADTSLVPESITTKSEFWAHVHIQLEVLLEGQTSWVSNLANTSSLVFNSLLAFPAHFGKDDDRAVNWCGFYLDSPLFPPSVNQASKPTSSRLLLGPFCGKPACQFINVSPGKTRGVCADAFLKQKTVLVPNVDEYPGHIACDGETKSEIVCPLIIRKEDGEEKVIGVFDLDCLALNGFDEDDRVGLEKIVTLVINNCQW